MGWHVEAGALALLHRILLADTVRHETVAMATLNACVHLPPCANLEQKKIDKGRWRIVHKDIPLVVGDDRPCVLA
jgi:hypothetical protein